MHAAGGKIADEGVPQGVKVSLALGVIGVGKEIRLLPPLSLLVVLCLFDPFCSRRVKIGSDHFRHMLSRRNGKCAAVGLPMLQVCNKHFDSIRPERQCAFPAVLAVGSGHGDGRLVAAEAKRRWR